MKNCTGTKSGGQNLRKPARMRVGLTRPVSTCYNPLQHQGLAHAVIGSSRTRNPRTESCGR